MSRPTEEGEQAMTGLRALAAAALMALVPLTALAQSRDQGVFDIYLRGVKAAQLGYSGVTEGGRYSAAAKLQTSGLIGWLRTMDYDAASRGTISTKGFVPSVYEEVRNSDGNVRKARMAYKGGVPQGRELTPPRPQSELALDPKTQGGTWDVMTAIYSVLGSQPKEQVCTVNRYLFDGIRRSQITLAAPKVQGDTITCAAEYRRIAGFRPDEMAERTAFPFTLTYAPNGNGQWHVTRVDMQTLYGKGSMVRR
jgi:hypothetical protein